MVKQAGGRTGRTQTAEFKARVAWAALREDQPLAAPFEVDPKQIADWKRQWRERAAAVCGPTPPPASVDRAPLQAKIGQQAQELDVLARARSQAGGLGAKL